MTPLRWFALVRALPAIVAMSVSPQGGATDDGARLEALAALLRQGHYEEAEATAAMLSTRAWSADAGKVRAHQLYVEALLRNGRAAEAKTLKLARELVADGSSPPSGPSAALSFRLLGLTTLEAGHYGEAKRHLSTARELDGRTFGPRSVQVAADLEGLARSLLWLEEPAAVDAIDTALAIRQNGPETDLAATLAFRAELHQRGGRYDLARTDIDRALHLCDRGTVDLVTTVAVFTVAADQSWIDGKYEEAAARARRAVGAAETAFRPGHPRLAAPLRCLANSLVETGTFSEARVARQRGLEIAEGALGPDHPLVAGQWHDLALSLKEQGAYGEARLALRRALAIYQRRLGPAHSFVTSSVFNLAGISLDIGDFREAAELFRQAATNWERRFGAAHPNMSWALMGRAQAAMGLGRHDEAVRLLERALSIRRKTMSGEHARVARTLTVLARSLADMGQMNRAIAASDESIQTWITSKQAEGLSEALLVRATIDATLGDSLRARASLERALQIRLELFGERHHSVGETLSLLSGTLAALGNADEAASVALRAETIEREHLRLTLSSLPERQALTFATSRPKPLDVALSALPAGGSPNETFDAVVRSRAVILDEMSARRQFLATTAGGALRPLLDARTAAAHRLASLVVRGLDGTSPRIYAAALTDAERERDATETALAEQSASFRNHRERRDVGLRDVSTSLPAASAMVSFVRYARTVVAERSAKSSGATGKSAARPSYLALIMRAGEPNPTVVDLGDAASLDRLVERWRRDVVGHFTDEGTPAPRAESALKARGATIRERVWDPLEAALARVDQVFIVPDGALNLLPFAALSAKDGRYLVETGPTLHYLSAERESRGPRCRSHPVGEGVARSRRPCVWTNTVAERCHPGPGPGPGGAGPP